MRLVDFTSDRELAARAETLAFRLLTGPNPLGRTEAPFGYRFGVWGVGIHAIRRRPVLFVDSKQLSQGAYEAAVSIPGPAQALAAITVDGDAWSDVIAWGMVEPTEQVSTGDQIRGASPETAGAPVEWTAGGVTKHGILTAGHVAGSATTITHRTSGANVGRIAQCVLPGTGGVDVAVIELSSASPSPRLIGPHALTGAANIELHKFGGPTAGQVVAKAGWFYWTSATATYVDLYITGATISRGGDSGSAVTLRGSAEVIGMLVGASTGSLIQDARTQMAAVTGLVGLTF